jgi:hypothetical protein
MDFLQGLQVSLFEFCKPNLQWTGALLREAKNTQQCFFSHRHLVTSKSTLQFPTPFKPGGTCIGVNGKWVMRVTADSGVDLTGQGHWSYIILSGCNAPDIMLVSAYRVCQQAGSQVGPLTSYAQQSTMTRTMGNKNPNPPPAFITDIIQFINEHRRPDRPLAVSLF